MYIYIKEILKSISVIAVELVLYSFVEPVADAVRLRGPHFHFRMLDIIEVKEELELMSREIAAVNGKIKVCQKWE